MKYTIGYGITGSFCTLSASLGVVEKLTKAGHRVLPVLSFAAATMDTRFMKASELKTRLETLTGNSVIETIQAAEPIGPKKLLDIMVVCPATGNTLAKLAHGITDTPVTMAVKSHLRNGRPVLLAVSSNDALGTNANNIAMLLNRKNIYIVPFRQDDCEGKPNSLISDFSLVPRAVDFAMQGKLIQPLLI